MWSRSSALTGEGVDQLRETISHLLHSGSQTHHVRLNAGDGTRIAWLHARGEVVEQQIGRRPAAARGQAQPGKLGPVRAALGLLRRDPERFHFIEAHLFEAGRSLDRAEPLLELAIGFAQCLFRVDVEMACEVDCGEQKVADLLLQLFRRSFGDLIKLFADLGFGAFDIGPVEASPRCALL